MSEQQEAALAYEDHVLVDLGNFRWIDVKRFKVANRVIDDHEALRSLLAHIRYRDHYASADSHESPTDDIHGPYRLSEITEDSFLAVDQQQADKILTDWLAFADDRPEVGQHAVSQFVFPLIESATSRYHLKNLGEEALHEWGWVLVDFEELILLNEKDRTLALVVAAED